MSSPYSESFVYRQVSLACWSEPVEFLDDGRLWVLWSRVLQQDASDQPTLVLARDVNGRVRARERKRFTPSDFSVTENEGDGFFAEMQSDPVPNRWVPPLLAIQVSRPVSSVGPWVISWSILEPKLGEERFCELLDEFLDGIEGFQDEFQGFAGASNEFSGVGMNTPYFMATGSTHHQVDFRRELVAVHWLNIAPSVLVSDEVCGELELLGVRCSRGPVQTVVQLTDRPSQMTEELVDQATKVMADVIRLHPRPLPDRWWCTS